MLLHGPADLSLSLCSGAVNKSFDSLGKHKNILNSRYSIK